MIENSIQNGIQERFSENTVKTIMKDLIRLIDEKKEKENEITLFEKLLEIKSILEPYYVEKANVAFDMLFILIEESIFIYQAKSALGLIDRVDSLLLHFISKKDVSYIETDIKPYFVENNMLEEVLKKLEKWDFIKIESDQVSLTPLGKEVQNRLFKRRNDLIFEKYLIVKTSLQTLDFHHSEGYPSYELFGIRVIRDGKIMVVLNSDPVEFIPSTHIEANMPFCYTRSHTVSSEFIQKELISIAQEAKKYL